MNKKITGDEPFYPTGYSQSGIGITIYQEAMLRFMVALSERWHNEKDAAVESKIWVDAYIQSLNPS